MTQQTDSEAKSISRARDDAIGLDDDGWLAPRRRERDLYRTPMSVKVTGAIAAFFSVLALLAHIHPSSSNGQATVGFLVLVAPLAAGIFAFRKL